MDSDRPDHGKPAGLPPWPPRARWLERLQRAFTAQRPPRPPLTQRLRPGHWIALDTIVAALFAVPLTLAIGNMLLRHGGAPLRAAVPLTSSFVLAGVMVLPVAVRRRGPLAAFSLSAATVTLVDVLTRGQQSPYLYLPTVYVLYLVAAQSRRRVATGALAALLTLLGLLDLRLYLDGGGKVVVLPVAFAAIITWTAGYTAGQRRAYAARLRDQAAASAVTEERLRIARELHDVVAHSMTVIAVQAGYGRHVIDGRPAQAREALGAIQTTSREALAEMRRMLGVLRQPEPASGAAGPAAAGPAGNAPWPANGAARRQDGLGRGQAPFTAPGLADLDRLVARITQTGVRVEVEMLGRPRELPPGIDLAAFRIVQEALTNVVKHAAASCCRVAISYAGDGLTVEVTDDGQGTPAPGGPSEPGLAARTDPAARVQGASRVLAAGRADTAGRADANYRAGADNPADVARQARAAGGAGQSSLAALAGLAGASGGHGLIGMRERVSLYGGEFSAGAVPGLGFRVTARLPLGDDARPAVKDGAR